MLSKKKLTIFAIIPLIVVCLISVFVISKYYQTLNSNNENFSEQTNEVAFNTKKDDGWSTEGYFSNISQEFNILQTLKSMGFQDINLNALSEESVDDIGIKSATYAYLTGLNSSNNSGFPDIFSNPENPQDSNNNNTNEETNSGGYSRSDVVSYSISNVSKSGNSAVVSGTAIMKDGSSVSGSVSLQKTNGNWNVVGYSY